MNLRILLYDFEFWISLMSIGFGVWVSTPSLTAGSSPALRAMLEFVGYVRWPWAIAFTGCGIVHLISLIKHYNGVREVVVLVLAPLWIATGVMGAQYMSTSTPSYIITGIAYAVAYMRVNLTH